MPPSPRARGSASALGSLQARGRAQTEVPLEQVAADQYASGDVDPRLQGANRLRAIMGQREGMVPTGPRPVDALLSSEDVSVTAKEDPEMPWPRNTDAIYLGTRTAPPTGTYTPPAGAPPKVSPAVAALWQKVRDRYPYAERFLTDLDTDPELDGTSVMGYYRDGGKIRLRPDEPRYGDPATLIHELTHAAQHQQFPSADQNDKHYRNYGGGERSYENRRGERAARASELGAQHRQSDEFDAAVDARMRAKEAAWRAGKGPKPGWMR